MSLAIITKMKPITRPISTSYKKLSLEDVEPVFIIEGQNSQGAWSKKQIIESIQNPINFCYSININNKIIGFLMAMPAIDTADILNISIASKFQRKGYGHKLLNYLIGELRDRGIGEILLEVRASNHSAASFYLKQNFTKVSVRKNYYMNNAKYPNQKEDGIMMRLKI